MTNRRQSHERDVSLVYSNSGWQPELERKDRESEPRCSTPRLSPSEQNALDSDQTGDDFKSVPTNESWYSLSRTPTLIVRIVFQFRGDNRWLEADRRCHSRAFRRATVGLPDLKVDREGRSEILISKKVKWIHERLHSCTLDYQI